MNSIYIGDRQLEPDDEFDCPYCNQPFSNVGQCKRHVAVCQDNPDADEGHEFDDYPE